MHRRGLHQPHVAIEPRPLVRPRLAETHVTADDEHIVLARLGEIGDVDLERRIAALVGSHDEAVEDHDAVAHHPVELEQQPPPRIRRVEPDHTPIPADAGRWPHPPDRLEPLERTRAIRLAPRRPELFERQVDRPVVRQRHRLPGAVVELRLGDRRADIARFGIGIVRTTKAEILRRIARVPQMKPPPSPERDDLARADRGRRPRRTDRHRRDDRGKRGHAARLQNVAADQARHVITPVVAVRNSPWRRRTSSAPAYRTRPDRYCRCRTTTGCRPRSPVGPCRTGC